MIDVFTKTQRVAYNYLIQRAKASTSVPPYIVPLVELENAIGSNRNNREFLLDSLAEMVTYPVVYDVFSKENNPMWRTHTTLFAHLSFSLDQTKLKYEFSSELLEIIKNPKMYARINFDEIIKIKSGAAIALYEFFHDVLGGRRNKCEYRMGIEELRLLLDWRDKYDATKELNRQLMQAVEQVNKVSKIAVSYKPIKDSRKVVGFLFSLERAIDPKEQLRMMRDMLR